MAHRWPISLVLGGMLALSMAACAGAECSLGRDHCDGNVAWVCNGGGDKGPLKWETRTCGEGTTCKSGTCFADPLKTCLPEEVGQWTCNPARTNPGQCTAAGYWAWDLAQDCSGPDLQCAQGRVDGASLAICVMNPNSTCPAGTPTRVCHNDYLTACTALSLQGPVQDCAAEGKVCRDGTCK